MGDFYAKTAAPTTGSSLSSSVIRAEFALIEAAFDKLPALTGNGSKFLRINSGATAVEALSASSVRTALGLVIGTDVQAWDADLDAIAALAKTDGNIIVGNGSTWVAESGATARTSLGLGTGDSPQFAGLNLGGAAITASPAELNKTDDSAAAVSGFVSGMRLYLNTDGGSTTAFDVDANVTENTFESVGPTGASADNTWTAMNDVSSGASAVILNLHATAIANTTDVSTSITVYARQTGSSATGNETIILNQLVPYDDSNTSTSGGASYLVFVPLDSSRRFDIKWVANQDKVGSINISLYLKGFIF